MNKIIKRLLITFLLCIIAIMVGCENKNTLVGRWEIKGDKEKTLIEFSRDGYGNAIVKDINNYNFTYSYEDYKLNIKFSNPINKEYKMIIVDESEDEIQVKDINSGEIDTYIKK